MDPFTSVLFVLPAMSDNSPFLSVVQEHPDRFIGPGVMSMFIQALQTGFLIFQVICFYSHIENESWKIRMLVGVTVSLAL